MKTEAPSQCELLERELRAGRKLTGMDIISMNILNYKGRIWDLRKRGLNINTRMVKTHGGAEIAEYSLPQGQLEINL